MLSTTMFINIGLFLFQSLLKTNRTYTMHNGEICKLNAAFSIV